jgi:pyruvate formate lyase activating enzyme
VYADMLVELIARCREAGIHTAIETSLVIFDEAVFSAVDYVMADIKIYDGEKHRKYVGQDNVRIFEHFRLLDRLGKPILVRTPIIPTVNDTPEEIAAIRDFVRSLDHAVGYELLPYHPLGEPKRMALGLEPTEFTVPTYERMEELRRYADLSRAT